MVHQIMAMEAGTTEVVVTVEVAMAVVEAGVSADGAEVVTVVSPITSRKLKVTTMKLLCLPRVEVSFHLAQKFDKQSSLGFVLLIVSYGSLDLLFLV